MSEWTETLRGKLPDTVIRSLSDFLAAANSAFGTHLKSAVLFGSAAEGRLRPASDVNLLLVLVQFTAEAAGAIESQLNFARAAIRLHVIFLLEGELQPSAVAFAQKFADMRRRHVVLQGDDPLASLRIPPEALRAQVAQVLLNLSIRLRERVASNWPREDQLAETLLEVMGPIRSCAANIVDMDGGSIAPKQALAQLVSQADARLRYLPELYSRLRERASPEAGKLAGAVLDTIALADWMRGRVS